MAAGHCRAPWGRLGPRGCVPLVPVTRRRWVHPLRRLHALAGLHALGMLGALRGLHALGMLGTLRGLLPAGVALR